MDIYSPRAGRAFPITRFIEGREEEVEELFGTDLSIIHQGGGYQGRDEVFLVELHTKLKTLAWEFIDSLYRSLAEKRYLETFTPPIREALTPSTPYSKYLSILVEILSNIIENERRIGLLNLFWLAHSKEVSEVINDYFGQEGVKSYLKYQMHPVLSGLYHGALDRALRSFESSDPDKLRYNLGADFNFRLIESIIDDQLPLTEPSSFKISLSQILIDQNKRFRLSFKEFKEIFFICRERLREGLQSRDESLLIRLKRHLPTIPSENYGDEKALVKIIFNTHILNYLFLDYGKVATKMLSNPILKGVTERGRGWSDLLDSYLDLINALKRTEVINILRQSITLLPPGIDDSQWRRLFSEGKLYRFQEGAEVLNTARKVSILFADLRGFTKTSEGGVSEKELTHHLYRLFDPLASIVKSFKGKIDKFTGDGVMITFGAERHSGEDELNALRTAISMQELLLRLRKEGKTHFQMGVSIHTGRAQLARFIVDDRNLDATVIGRNVNIAGRLSASGPSGHLVDDAVCSGDQTDSFYVPIEGHGLSRDSETTAKGKTVAGVRLDEQGNLLNKGIVLTQDTLDELLKSVEVQALEGEGVWSFFDERLEKNILIEYVGDVKFRGLERAIPLYAVSYGYPQ